MDGELGVLGNWTGIGVAAGGRLDRPALSLFWML